MAKVQSVQVGDHEGQRLDNFLMSHLRGVPRSHIFKMIRTGEVRVNGSRCRPHTRLDASDFVRIPPVRVRNDEGEIPIPPGLLDKLRQAVVYEDSNVIILDKPVGVAVHRGTGERVGIAEVLGRLFETDAMHLLHRLDKATSGCLAIAKNRRTMIDYHRWFREGVIKKKYDVIVEGRWFGARQTVDARLERFHLANGERRVRVNDRGQLSRTEFRVVKRAPVATWLTAHPATGRTHQIRVHAQFINHSILGDRKYGNRHFRPTPPRMMLHARTIALPGVGTIEAPLPAAFSSYWSRLQAGD